MTSYKHTGHENTQDAYPQLPNKNSSSPLPLPPTVTPCFLRKKEMLKNKLHHNKKTLKNNSPKTPSLWFVFSSPDNPKAARKRKALVLGRVAKARFTRQHAARSSAPKTLHRTEMVQNEWCHCVCNVQLVIFFNKKYRYTMVYPYFLGEFVEDMLKTQIEWFRGFGLYDLDLPLHSRMLARHHQDDMTLFWSGMFQHKPLFVTGILGGGYTPWN